MLRSVAPLMSAVASQFNSALSLLVKQWNRSHSNTHLVYYDAHKALTEIAHDFAAEGVDLTAHAITSFFHSNPPTIEVHGIEGPLFFYDQTHPTTLVWKRFAQKFQESLNLKPLEIMTPSH